MKVISKFFTRMDGKITGGEMTIVVQASEIKLMIKALQCLATGRSETLAEDMENAMEGKV